eukprot:TRINITY_DN1537_c0_g1_i2.p1 TRINITY_DN1537_c0_g1~~TRINITY_DN1537_c0_g1_i2.p1  ORF type:complete len:188 (+),score=13.31 TRINITY_DN1537_c0_g1_i2:65-628(+)
MCIRDRYMGNTQSFQKFKSHSSSLASQEMAENTNNADYLNLKVKSQDGEEVFFRIRKTTQLKKLMDAYCQRQSVSFQNVRFLFDGERISDTQTPEQLQMENGDEIDVVIEQTGGAFQNEGQQKAGSFRWGACYIYLQYANIYYDERISRFEKKKRKEYSFTYKISSSSSFISSSFATIIYARGNLDK